MPQTDLDIELILDMAVAYLDEELDMQLLAARYDVPPDAIRIAFDEWGVPLREHEHIRTRILPPNDDPTMSDKERDQAMVWAQRVIPRLQLAMFMTQMAPAAADSQIRTIHEHALGRGNGRFRCFRDQRIRRPMHIASIADELALAGLLPPHRSRRSRVGRYWT